MKLTTLCFLVKEREVLLAYKKRGFGAGKWNGVGGKVEVDDPYYNQEDIPTSALREIYEEIGVKVDLRELKPAGDIKFFFKEHPEWDNHMHIFVVYEWRGVPHESEEMRPEWFGKEKLPFDNMWADDSHWLPLVLEGEKISGEFHFDKSGEFVLSHFVHAVGKQGS